MDKKSVNKINKKLAEWSKGNLSLQEFLSQIQKMEIPNVPQDDIVALNQATEGIYCGEEGKIHEQIPGTKYWLAFGWYTRINRPIVEWAYIS